MRKLICSGVTNGLGPEEMGAGWMKQVNGSMTFEGRVCSWHLVVMMMVLLLLLVLMIVMVGIMVVMVIM